jgi:DNA polymerase-3 subunit beta
MKIQILQENLIHALSRVSRITPQRPQLPILLTVKLEATKDGLEITATNLETTETVWVGAKTEEEGSVCVNAKTLQELIGTIPPGTVVLTRDNETLKVVSGGFDATLPATASREYPQTPTFSPGQNAQIDKTIFMNALSTVLFAAATDESRPILTGVRVVVQPAESLFVATDGYRLSLKRLPVTLERVSTITIPARALSEIVKLSSEEKEETSLILGSAGENQLGFKIGETTLITRLLDGEYPNFERIIPKTHTTAVKIEREALLRAVRAAAIFARDNANIVRLEITKENIIVSANAAQTGKNAVELSADVEGDGGEIAFNSRFLIDFLTNFHEEEIVFQMTGALNSGLFKGSKDDSFLHIIMPVRVSS